MAPNLPPGRPSSHPRASAYAFLITLSVIWGLAFVAIRSADFELSPFSLLLIRWLIASAGFALLLPFARPKTKFERKDFPRLLVFAIMTVVLYGTAINYAETSISSGLAGLIVSLGPVFMVALSAVVLAERVTRRLLYALALAVAGSVLLSVSDLSISASSLMGALEAIAAALVYAGFTVLAKPLIEKYGALSVTIWGSLVGTVFLIPLASSEFFRQVSALSADGWLSVLFLSILSTVFGYTAFYSLVGRGSVATLSVQLYLIPIVSVVGGILLLGESLTAFTIVGGAVTLLAVGLVRTKRAA